MPKIPSTRKKRTPHSSKVKSAVDSIRAAGWRSVNEFLEAFYSEPAYAAQSLRLQPGSRSAPSRLLDIWIEQVPSGEAKQELDMAITKKAAEIMIKESTTAYRDHRLQVSSSGLDIPYLTSDFGLKKMQDIYTALLPCLTFLLYALLTAQNDYERRKGKDKVGKDKMAWKVRSFGVCHAVAHKRKGCGCGCQHSPLLS